MFLSSVFHHRTHEQGLRAQLARLLIAGIAGLLAACAAQPDVGHGQGDATAQQSAADEPTRSPPRLRRDSIARSAIVNAFGNLALQTAIDAPCGYRDADTAVVCLNVAGELNAPDVDLIRARIEGGATARVRDEIARSLLLGVPVDATVQPTAFFMVANTTDSCRGACAGRIELVRTR